MIRHFAFGSENDGIEGAFSGQLKNNDYQQDYDIINGKDPEHLKKSILLLPPDGLSQETFDQNIIKAGDSFGNNDGITYNLNPGNDLTEGNCNTSTSTILYKAGVSDETIKKIGDNIPGTKWGWGIIKPWTNNEQQKAVEEQKEIDDRIKEMMVAP